MWPGDGVALNGVFLETRKERPGQEWKRIGSGQNSPSIKRLVAIQTPPRSVDISPLDYELVEGNPWGSTGQSPTSHRQGSPLNSFDRQLFSCVVVNLIGRRCERVPTQPPLS